MAIGESGHSDK